MDGIDKLPATHPDRVKQHLPSEEQAYRQSQRMSEIADSTKRSGAGVTKGSGLILRPSGQKAVDEFQEKFLDTGKYTPTKAPEFTPNEYKGHGKPDELPPLRIVQLPLDWCPDCEKQVPKGGGSFCVYPIFQAYPGLNLRPGDLFRHVLCRTCIDDAKKDRESRVQTFYQGEWVPQAVFLKAKRMKRIAQNVEDYSRMAYGNRRNGIFFDERGRDVFRKQT